MQLGMIGLGRMGGSMVIRLTKAGHECLVYDSHHEAVDALVAKGAKGTTSLPDFVRQLSKPRLVWLMVPAAVVDPVLKSLVPLLEKDDIVVDGGNSYYHDDIRRAEELHEKGLHYVDVGVSGGVWGLERGYCHMIGGEPDVVKRLDPIFRSLAPGVDAAPRTPGATGNPGTAEQGYLHCGPNGAGHFVKMVHNGIEYGLMAAYAEGLNIIKHANVGSEDAGGGCRDDAAAPSWSVTNTTSISARSRRSGGVAALLPPGCSTLPPVRCGRAPILATSLAVFRIPARAAGRCRQRSMKACRRR